MNCTLLMYGLGIIFLVSQVPRAWGEESLTVHSPNGNIVVTFEIKSNLQPYLSGRRAYYKVSYKGQSILEDSPLGIDFKDEGALGQDLEVTGTRRETRDSSWNWRFGAQSQIRNHYRQLTILLREARKPNKRVDVVIRIYNQGFALRYILPRQKTLDKFIISNEQTGFYFAQSGLSYALNLGRFNSNYEGEFRSRKLNDIQPESIVGLPLAVHLNNGPWVAVLEANLNDYAGMYLAGVPGVPHALRCKLSPSPDRMDESVKGQTPFSSPWRVVLISSTAGGLIDASDPIILNLNEPSAIGDDSWIHPGKVAWDWWSGDYASGVAFKPGMNTPTMEHYIDFASRAHLRYMLIDAGWSPDTAGHCSKIKPDQSTVPERGWCSQNDITHWVKRVNLPVILSYAKQRNVKILLWIHWTAAAAQMEKAFPLFEKWGVGGVKVDFMDDVPDDQATVNLYRKLVSMAAKYHLLIDIHGAYKPTGLRRTYPNLLTREGVLGLEYNKWSYRDTPTHDVTIPFTRMLAGPMDYTPGCFNNASREKFRPQNTHPMCQGTRAHQLAMYVVFLSPLEMLSDYPEDYVNQPGFEFLEKVPSVWDETHVLEGTPSESITIARRRGGDWFLGSMTNWKPRTLSVPLRFLGSGEWTAQMFLDGPDADRNAKSLVIQSRQVVPTDTLTLNLASGGGAAIIFKHLR